jgi:hypothetical protein
MGKTAKHLIPSVTHDLTPQRTTCLDCGGQAADHKQIPDRVGTDVLGPAAHVLLFKTGDSFADHGFDFSLSFHGDLERLPRDTAETIGELTPLSAL